MPVGVFFRWLLVDRRDARGLPRGRAGRRVEPVVRAAHGLSATALVWATAAASVTQRATLAARPRSAPILWPPLPVAMAISTLGEFAQERVILNVSVGNILDLRQSGMEPVKPIRIMREYVEDLRALWAGKPVTHEGELHKLRGAKMVFDQGRQYPIYHRIDRTADAQARGRNRRRRVLSAGLTLASSTRCLELAAAGVQCHGARSRGAAEMHLHQLQRLEPTAQPPRPRCCASSHSCSAAAVHADNIKSSEPRYRPSGDHGRRMPATISTARFGCCRRRPPTSSPPPGRRRNAGPGWRSICAIGLDRAHHRGLGGVATSASSRSTSSATLRDGRRVDEHPVADA